ncbi:MAG: hypothetical protein GY853_03185 [PVC group bacterium]|nr:hypothetical protein [PVC group bacterium]
MNNTMLSAQDNQFYEKGISALKKKNYAYALELFQQVLSTNPDYTPCLHNLWTTAREKKKSSSFSIITFIKEIIQTFILNVEVTYAILLSKKKSIISIQEQIILLNPDNTSAFYKLATFFMQQNKTKHAKTALEEVMLINRNHLKTLILLANIYFSEKDYSKATLTARMILEITPNNLQAENILKDIAALGVIEEGFNNIRPAT